MNRHLLYTVALDFAGGLEHRLMAKMLAGSLLRTYFAGTVKIIRNTPEPLFRLLREGLEEVYVESPEVTALSDAKGAVSRENLAEVRRMAGVWKLRARSLVDAENCEVVVYADADCVALRGIEHLMEGGDWDIRYLPAIMPVENGEVSSAVWAVQAGVYVDVMQEWSRRIQPLSTPGRRTDHLAWSSLIGDCRAGRLPWRAKKFEAHEILCPLLQPLDWPRCREAALLHCGGLPAAERIEFMFAMYMQKYFSDPRGTLLNILEM